MDNGNAELIERFYAAFADHDGDTMAACYAPQAHFWDPVFTDLEAGEPGAMWQMLTQRATDLKIELLDHQVQGDTGTAHWVAHYTFQTGRKVRNDVHATFTFADGLIVDHKDSFDLWEWTRQALGLPGKLLGWSPIIQGPVRRKARAQLDAYLAGKDAAVD
ncbi:MAG: nuclear transport factor 2 family protein [Euzebya sp.]